MDWLNELQKISASPENEATILTEIGEIDILNTVSEVSAPTVVLHSRDVVVVPSDQARRLAAMNPNTEFIPLDRVNHLVLDSEPARPIALRAIRRYLDEDPAADSVSTPQPTLIGNSLVTSPDVS